MFALHRHAYGFPTTSTHRSPPKGVFTSETNAGSAVPTVSGGGTADEHARFGAPREDVAGDDTSSHHSNSTVADDGTQTGARSDEDADDVTDDDGDHSHVIKQTSAPKPRKRSVRPVPVHRSPHNTMQKFPTGAHPQLQSGSIANGESLMHKDTPTGCTSQTYVLDVCLLSYGSIITYGFYVGDGLCLISTLAKSLTNMP